MGPPRPALPGVLQNKMFTQKIMCSNKNSAIISTSFELLMYASDMQPRQNWRNLALTEESRFIRNQPVSRTWDTTICHLHYKTDFRATKCCLLVKYCTRLCQPKETRGQRFAGPPVSASTSLALKRIINTKTQKRGRKTRQKQLQDKLFCFVCFCVILLYQQRESCWVRPAPNSTFHKK